MCIPSPSVKSIETFDEETIRQKAIFFEKNVSSYQKSVNEASVNLCLKNPSLLFMKRGDLFNMAKEKVHEDGYNYKEKVVPPNVPLLLMKVHLKDQRSIQQSACRE